MRDALVIGISKTGTTIVASVIQQSIPEARLFVEPRLARFFEKLARFDVPRVVKLLYDHWMQRPYLLTGIVRGEAGFRADRTVAIVRDPRDGLISSVMYRAYECVLAGASEDQVEQWLRVLRDKEIDPRRHSLIGLIAELSRIFGVADSADSFLETFASYGRWIAANRERLHVMKYEDFVAGDTAALAAYLGIALSASREVDPTLRRVARTRRSGDWRSVMLREDVAYLQNRFGTALAEHGYGDWDIAPATTDPAMGSEYVRRITREAFQTLREQRGEAVLDRER